VADSQTRCYVHTCVTESQHGNAESQHGDAESQHGNAESHHGNAESQHDNAESQHGNAGCADGGNANDKPPRLVKALELKPLASVPREVAKSVCEMIGEWPRNRKLCACDHPVRVSGMVS
jgi:hypothetical protein